MARYRRLLPVVALFTLHVLAALSPPDSAFGSGIYDDGDHDDVIGWIDQASALPIGATPAASAALLAPAGRVLAVEPRPAGGVSAPPHRPRAPPSAPASLASSLQQT